MKRFCQKFRRIRLTFLAAAVVLVLVPASALAASVVFLDGALTAHAMFHAQEHHALTQVSGRKLDNTATETCVNALELNLGLAGEWHCTAQFDEVTIHDYCGCQQRYALIWNNGVIAQDLRGRYAY